MPRPRLGGLARDRVLEVDLVADEQLHDALRAAGRVHVELLQPVLR